MATHINTSCATHWDPEGAVGRACGIVLIHRGGDSHRKGALMDAAIRIAAASERIPESHVQAWVGVGGW